MVKRGPAQPEHVHATKQPLVEALSVCNVTAFYSEELRQISEGQYTPGLLTNREKRKLSKIGILRKGDNNQLTVPWEVEKLLENLK